MANVILEITYEVDPSKRSEYLRLIEEMKTHFTTVRKKEYRVFEVKGKTNAFVEQFVCGSMEEYEKLEDDLDEKSETMVDQLGEMIRDGTTRYSTLVEVS